MSVQEMAAEAAEKSLIGALVFDRDAIAAVSDRITDQAFASPKYRAIYAAVQRCWVKRIAPDIMTVHAEMAHDPLFATEHDWMHGVLDLTEAIEFVVANGYGCHAPMYAELVVAHARRRAMSEAGSRIVALAHQSGDFDPDLAMHEALSGLDRFGSVEGPQGPQTYEEIIPDYQERVMRMRSGEIPNRVTATGFRAVDRKLSGGVYPGELVIVAARPSMGKTAFALQVGHNVAKAGKHVVVFSAEMSKESLLKRAVSELSGQPGDVSEFDLRGQAFDLFLQSLERLRRLPMSIDDTPGITTAQMTVRVQAMQRRHDVGLVVFDYIELAGDQVQGDSEERRINGIVKSLKTMGRVCDVPVVAICQLNRQVESRQDKRPMLADLRYSGSIEQDADKVLFLYRHDYYVNQGTSKPETGSENVAEVIVSKHRNGPTGKVNLHFTAETMRFHDIDTLRTEMPTGRVA